MKVQDLHTLRICPNDILVECKESGFSHAFAIFRGDDGRGEFESNGKAVEAAALFRSAYKMQEALKAIAALTIQTYSRNDAMIFETARAALALSENTDETVTT